MTRERLLESKTQTNGEDLKLLHTSGQLSCSVWVHFCLISKDLHLQGVLSQQLHVPEWFSSALCSSPVTMRSAVVRPTVSTTSSAWLGTWASSRVWSSASASPGTWIHLKEAWTPCCRRPSVRWVGRLLVCLRDRGGPLTQQRTWTLESPRIVTSLPEQPAAGGFESEHVKGPRLTTFQGITTTVVKSRNRLSMTS